MPIISAEVMKTIHERARCDTRCYNEMKYQQYVIKTVKDGNNQHMIIIDERETHTHKQKEAKTEKNKGRQKLQWKGES